MPRALERAGPRPPGAREGLIRYAKVGFELLEMADEGLVLAARGKARLGQALSAAQHAEGHLQVVGVGDWKPTGTRPAWNAKPRLTEDDSQRRVSAAIGLEDLLRG